MPVAHRETLSANAVRDLQEAGEAEQLRCRSGCQQMAGLLRSLRFQEPALLLDMLEHVEIAYCWAVRHAASAADQAGDIKQHNSSW